MWEAGGLPRRTECRLDALVFSFDELPLWNAAAIEATRDPSMIGVDLCGMNPGAISTTLVPPLFSTVKPQSNIAETLNLHIQGALERLQQTLPTTSMPISQHSTPRREPPLVALGVPPHGSRRPTWPKGSRLIHT